jgi:hypothetical protein
VVVLPVGSRASRVVVGSVGASRIRVVVGGRALCVAVRCWLRHCVFTADAGSTQIRAGSRVHSPFRVTWISRDADRKSPVYQVVYRPEEARKGQFTICGQLPETLWKTSSAGGRWLRQAAAEQGIGRIAMTGVGHQSGRGQHVIAVHDHRGRSQDWA